MILNDLSIAFPEVFLAISIMAVTLFGAFTGNKQFKVISWISVFVLLVVMFLLDSKTFSTQLAFNDLYVTTSFIDLIKLLIVGSSIIAIVYSITYFDALQIKKF